METISKERLAEIINGREYREEVTPEIEQVAKASNLVIIYWYSDDWVELRWAINDELWAYNWTSFYISKSWKLLNRRWETSNEIDDLDINDNTKTVLKELYIKYLSENAANITADYDTDWYSWVIKTDCPHSTFEIMEEWEKFCKWIVINLNDIWND